jgi:hypothetical protein
LIEQLYNSFTLNIFEYDSTKKPYYAKEIELIGLYMEMMQWQTCISGNVLYRFESCFPYMKNIFERAKLKGYDGEIKLSLLEDWLRENKYIHCEIFFSLFHKKWSLNNYFINTKKLKRIEWDWRDFHFETYPEAQEFAIDKMLEKI